MNLCSHTNFGALFSTVDVDFRFFAHIKIFEIASAKLRERQHWQTISYIVNPCDGLNYPHIHIHIPRGN